MACEARIIRGLGTLEYPRVGYLTPQSLHDPEELARVVSWLEDRKVNISRDVNFARLMLKQSTRMPIYPWIPRVGGDEGCHEQQTDFRTDISRLLLFFTLHIVLRNCCTAPSYSPRCEGAPSKIALRCVRLARTG